MKRARAARMQSSPSRAASNWALVCAHCPMEWSDTTTTDVMELHMSTEHPEVGSVDLKTEWRGKGPEPVNEDNRAARRRQARARKKKGR